MTKAAAKNPVVGWGGGEPPSVGLPPPSLHPIYHHALVPDLSVIARDASGAKNPALAEITRSHQSFPDVNSLGAEVLRLKKELAAPGHDEATRAALVRQIAYRQTEWVAKAKMAGMQEPSGPVDPFHSTKKEIENAFLWSACGGVIPREELARDGGHAFLTSVRDAVVMRTRGFDAMLALHQGHPEEERNLLERELACRGVKVPEGANLETGHALYRQSLRDEEAARKQIGQSGRVGRAETLDHAERQETIEAMNPGSTLGSMMATYSTLVTGSVDLDRMHAMGDTGNAAEGVLGSTGEPAK